DAGYLVAELPAGQHKMSPAGAQVEQAAAFTEFLYELKAQQMSLHLYPVIAMPYRIGNGFVLVLGINYFFPVIRRNEMHGAIAAGNHSKIFFFVFQLKSLGIFIPANAAINIPGHKWRKRWHKIPVVLVTGCKVVNKIRVNTLKSRGGLTKS